MTEPEQLRELIISYLIIKQYEDVVPPWEEVLCFLLRHGAMPDDAMAALAAFANELLAERAARMN